MPAWIIDDPTVSTGTGDAILTYWRKACEAEEGRQLSPDQYEYYRVKETPYAPQQEKEAYRVATAAFPVRLSSMPNACSAVSGRTFSIVSAAG